MNEIKNEKIFMGFDASGDRGIEYQSDSNRYFTIVAVTTSDFEHAKETAMWVESKWPGLKGMNLHSKWEEIVDRLSKSDFQFFILYVDKDIFRGKIDKTNYNRLSFWRVEYSSDGTSQYTVINDEYAKHGWLVVEILKIQGYRGPTEVRWDKDLQGYGWEMSKKKMKEHAENWLGRPCDLQDSGMEYPLVQIADIVANFVNWQLEGNMKENEEPAIVNRLRSKVRKMNLTVAENISMMCEDGAQ